MNKGRKSKSLRLIPKGVALIALLIGIAYFLLQSPSNLSSAILQLLIIIVVTIISFILSFIIIHGWKSSMDEFKKHFIVNYELLIILILLLTAGLFYVLLSHGYTQNNTEINERYILSAVFQGLAALFALTFTISLIVLQVSYKYISLIDQFFRDWFNVFYPVFSAICIIFPIVALKLEWFNWGTSLAVAGAFACVFLIIPFILRMKSYIKCYVGIREFVRKARDAIRINDRCEYNQIIDEVILSIPDAIAKEGYTILVQKLDEIRALVKYCRDTILRLKEREDLIYDTLFGYLRLLEITQNMKQLGKYVPYQYELIEMVTIMDVVSMHKTFVYHHMIEVFTHMITKASTERIKKILCRNIWFISAKWLDCNPTEQNTVKRSIKKVAKTVGQDLFFQSNDPCGSEEYGENVYEAYGSDERKIKRLEQLRSWASGIDNP